MPEFKITDHEVKVLGDDPTAIAIQGELKKVTGKYQSLALAILLLGLPGMKDMTWDEFEGTVDTAARDTLSEKMITLGFSKEFVDSVNGPEDKPVGEKLSGIIAAKDSLQAVRASVFGEKGVLPIFAYDGPGVCDLSKMLTLVLQARTEENALRTAILLAGRF